VFFYDFDEFYNISIFIEKKKNEKKEKGLHRLGSAYNEASPTARIQPRWKKKPIRRGSLGSGHFASGTLIYFKNY
jgi:hypothetical protein